MKFTLAMAALILVWPFASTKEYRMTSGAGVPAAAGIVKVQKDKDNGNMKLEIKVSHLARPSSLTPSASNYLVWIRPNGGDALKQGAIGVDKNLSGELTVEQSDSVTVPSSIEVLRTHVSTD